MTTPSHEQLLRDAGLRATPGRIALLHALAKEPKPVPVEKLAKSLKGKLNQVTLYRALEAFENANIVTRAGLGHEHAHYELLLDRPHHHHAVCRACGHVEDIEIPHSPSPEKDAERRAKGFASIDRYSLEFFGTCRSCA
ncbi:MAG TPA: Fur family transcriptional regulator [Candidatus Paceibacterota bacterium]